nr:DUF4364 family protein [Gottschalkia acidurici]
MFTEDTNELVQYKLLILYILEKVDIPMTNSEITQFILENNYMNYFMVQQFLSELVNSKFVEFSTKDGSEYYHLSKAGKDTLVYFNDRIPQHLKDEVDRKHEDKKIEMIKETQVIGHYFKKSDSEYIVNLRAVEKDMVLLNLSLSVVSSKQAKLICNNWKENPHDIYKKVVDLLIQE